MHIDDLVDVFAHNEPQSAANESFNLGLRPSIAAISSLHCAATAGEDLDVPQPIDHLIRHGIDLYGRFSGEIRSTGYTQLFRYPHGKAENSWAISLGI